MRVPRLLCMTAIGVVASSSLTVAATAAPARHGGSDQTRVSVACGPIATVLTLRPGGGGTEVEYQLDQNRNGRTWHLSMTSGGTVIASDTRTTKAPSGAFTWRVVAPEGAADVSVTASRGARTCTISSGAGSASSTQGDSIVVSKCYTNATKTTGGELLIKASSSDPTARLIAYRPDGSVIGEVQNGGGSRYGGTVMPYQSSDPGRVTIKSSSGGSVTVPTGPFQL